MHYYIKTFPLLDQTLLLFKEEEILQVIPEFSSEEKKNLEARENYKYNYSPAVEKLIREFSQYFQGVRKKFTSNFTIKGTDFAQSVYQKLLLVDYGECISYGELAREAGYPGAARAVGQVLTKNKLPILLPCHRVIKAEGSLGGYKWGQELKKQLLQLEKKQESK